MFEQEKREEKGIKDKENLNSHSKYFNELLQEQKKQPERNEADNRSELPSLSDAGNKRERSKMKMAVVSSDVSTTGGYNGPIKLLESGVDNNSLDGEREGNMMENIPIRESSPRTGLMTHLNESFVYDINKQNGIFEIDLKCDKFMHQVAGSWSEFKEDCFLKGCKWSPDGLCLLTNSNDTILRIFNLPFFLQQNDSQVNENIKELVPVLKMNEGETIYDFDWYPSMSSYDPSSCCLISTSRDHPVHLWDAFTGHLRCSYLSFNHLDEIVAANSICFNLDGSKIYCGFNKVIRIFDTSRPGREFAEYATVVKNSSFHQSGIISSIAFSNQLGKMFALGSFEKSVGVYSERDADLICMLPGKLGGITEVQFSKDGALLYAGARKDENIYCWDLRNANKPLFLFKRDVTTNQKIQFDIHWSDRYLFSGNTNGFISIWDMKSDPVSNSFHAHQDVVNGISIHPYLPLIASTSGQRHFSFSGTSSIDSDDSDQLTVDNSLRIWKFDQLLNIAEQPTLGKETPIGIKTL